MEGGAQDSGEDKELRPDVGQALRASKGFEGPMPMMQDNGSDASCPGARNAKVELASSPGGRPGAAPCARKRKRAEESAGLPADRQAAGENGGPGQRGSPAAGSGGWGQLLPDLWERVWAHLSIRELSRLASVSREWRAGVTACIQARRRAAVALVTAPDDVPDSQLSAGQWVFRAASRLLLSFSRRALDVSAAGWTEGYGFVWEKKETDERGTLEQWVDEDEGGTLEFTSSGGHMAWRSTSVRISFELDRECPPSTSPFPLAFMFQLMPHSPEESVWMQGLLLALSQGALEGLVPQGTFPRLRGPLASCVKLTILWWNMEDRLAVWRQQLRRGQLEILHNPWPPTCEDNYVPLTLLTRAPGPPSRQEPGMPLPHHRTFLREASS